MGVQNQREDEIGLQKKKRCWAERERESMGWSEGKKTTQRIYVT